MASRMGCLFGTSCLAESAVSQVCETRGALATPTARKSSTFGNSCVPSVVHLGSVRVPLRLSFRLWKHNVSVPLHFHV